MSHEEELVTGLIQEFRNFERSKWKHTPHMIIKPSAMMLLFCLKKRPSAADGLKASEISELLKLAPPTVTPLLNSLEEAGYIKRLADSRDRRVVLIQTTPQGIALVEEAEKRFLGNISELVDFLGEDDSRALIRLLHLTSQFFSQKRAAEARAEE